MEAISFAKRLQDWRRRMLATAPAPLVDGWPNPNAVEFRAGPAAGDGPRVTIGTGRPIALGAHV